jgi:hypothetical protein
MNQHLSALGSKHSSQSDDALDVSFCRPKLLDLNVSEDQTQPTLDVPITGRRTV